MRDHAGFGVEPRRHLQQCGRPTRFVPRIGPMQHQSLSATAHDLGKFVAQALFIGNFELIDQSQPWRHAADQRFQSLQPFGESARRLRQLENHVAYQAPLGVIWRIAANRRGKAIECPPADPEFAIERLFRQALEEPSRRRNPIATAETQLPAIPDRANAIELFTDPVSRDVDPGTVLPGKKQIGRLHGNNRQGGA